MKAHIKKISVHVSAFIFLLMAGCSPMSQEIRGSDTESLADKWLHTKSSYERASIIAELERRKDYDGLMACLANARYLYKTGQTITVAKLQSTDDDVIKIIEALGRMKNPDSIDELYKTGSSGSNRVKIAILKASKQIGHPGAATSAASYLSYADSDLRMQALDTLGFLKDPSTVDAIIPMVFDKNAAVRWKAVHALGEIGDPKAINPLSMLLADSDESVRNSAEAVLRKLGVAQAKIDQWKDKAKQVSIEDVYSAKIAYQRAETEKTALQEKLESEADIKQKLEETLVERENALKRKEQVVASLYENERQLKSKLNQLELSTKQSAEYRKELEKLNAKADALNRELNKTNRKKSSANVEAELEQILLEKERLEKEAQTSKQNETVLQTEISALKTKSEETRQEAENARKELADTRTREADLAKEVEELRSRLNRGMEPVVVISKPQNGAVLKVPSTTLHIIAVDDKGVDRIRVTLNGQPLELDSGRGIKGITRTDSSGARKVDVNQRLNLAYGKNTIKVAATDVSGIVTEEVITITRIKEQGRIWAAVIGINNYKSARKLKYATNDALGFKKYLINYIGMPKENIFYLTDQRATKSSIQSLLGTHLKRKAGAEDTVIIFYAGHGAVESDPSNPDGDGFEKYLLPYDADLRDLYSTSISMDEIRKVFQRIQAERLIFIADTCYSGASGGRTLLASKSRASISDKFFNRITKGKGRVIISSCSANEISKEDDNLQHGVFSYYLLEGLKGQADKDADGIITVSELFSYLSRKVPEASGQDQHPVKKGESEGELIIGRTR